jgi:hypothetical protein
VTTNPVVSVAENSANLAASINPNGLSTSYSFQYGTTTEYGSNSIITIGLTGTTSQAVTTSISGLLSNTTYHYRVEASSSSGTSYGADRSFTTIAPDCSGCHLQPQGTMSGRVHSSGTYLSGVTISTSAVGGHTAVTNTIGGLTGAYVLGHPTGTYTVTASKSGYISSSQSVTVTQGVETTANFVLSPLAVAPTVTTNTASGISASGAILNAGINPNGFSTTYYFQYGPTASYGSTTSPTSGMTGTTVLLGSKTISGLLASTTYHYQIVAYNSGGTSYGADRTFATSILDADGDGVADNVDNCPNNSNANQADTDSDGLGDVCDACPNDAANDVDGDGVCGDMDNCPVNGNANQSDTDSDGLGDVCDACPNDTANDADNDGVCGNIDNCPTDGNANQSDTDSDGLGDVCDTCPNDTANDADGDGVCGDIDNCPVNGNANQADTDSDGMGDACDPCPQDNPDDPDNDGVCTSSDTCSSGDDSIDLDGDSIPDACDVCEGIDDRQDADSDGVPNCIDGDDTDSDGFTDTQEVQCGTDPALQESRCSYFLPFMMLLLE